MSNLRQTPLTCSGHTRPVVNLAFSDITDCGYFLISACKDGKPMLRQGDTGDWIGTFEGHKGAVWGVALNKDATIAATGAADFLAKVHHATTMLGVGRSQRGRVAQFSTQTHRKSVNFSSDSGLFTTASNEKVIRIFDLNRPEASPSTLNGHSAGIRHVFFLRNDTRLVSCADDCTLRVWDRNSLQEVRNLSFNYPLTSLEVSKDGSILTVAYAKQIAFVNSETLEVIREVKVPTQVYSASLHPDKTIFVCGGEDFKMYKYDYSTGDEIDSFKGHFGPVHCVRFSPDGELYASGSEDGTLRLWQTTVGKTYGLWKCVDSVLPVTTDSLNNSIQEVFAN